MEAVFAVVLAVIDVLIGIGLWFMNNPVEALAFLIGTVVVFFVLRQVLGVAKALLAFVAFVLIVAIGVWYLWPLAQSWWLGTPTDSAIAENWLEEAIGEERYASLQQVDEAAHTATEGWYWLAKYESITDAPDLKGLSYDAGIQELAVIADEHPGEVLYFYIHSSAAAPRWSEGTVSRNSYIRATRDMAAEITKDTTRVVKVHTHPSAFSVSGLRIPPSFQDVEAAVFDAVNLQQGITWFDTKWVVVQADRQWQLDVSAFATRLRDTAQAMTTHVASAVDEIIDELQPLYVCEVSEVRIKPCNQVTAAERNAAVDRLLELYASLGIGVSELPLPGTDDFSPPDFGNI